MAARPARRKSSSRGSVRRRQAGRGGVPARQPARVTAKRLEGAVASLHLPYSVTPDKEIRVMVDAGVISLVLDGTMLRVGTWWLERAPLSLEVPLLVVANGWNLDRSVPVAGVTDVENGGALLVSGSQCVPVGAGLSDEQLVHVVEDAVDDCVALLGHLEEVFPQTRFDAMAGAVGLSREDGGVVEPTAEESAQQARELVGRAKEVLDSDPDGAGALLVGAMEHARRADLAPQDVGADEALTMLLEHTVADRGVAGTPQAAAAERLLEGVRSGGLTVGGLPGGEPGPGGESAPVAGRLAAPAQEPSGGGTGPGQDDGKDGAQQAVTLTRARELLAAAGRKVAEDPVDSLGAVGPGGSGGAAGSTGLAAAGPGEPVAGPGDGAQRQDQALLVEVGERMAQVSVEGDDLVVRSRWEAPEESQASDALAEAALVVSGGWNRGGRVLGARVLLPEGVPEGAPEGDGPGAAGDASAETTGAGGAAAGRTEKQGGQERLVVEGYARWCVAPGASDAQLSQMLEAALVEVEYLARYCSEYVVEELVSPELVDSAGQAESAEPVGQQAESAEPVGQQAELVEPVGPAGQAELVEPVGPAGQAEQAEPVGQQAEAGPSTGAGGEDRGEEGEASASLAAPDSSAAGAGAGSADAGDAEGSEEGRAESGQSEAVVDGEAGSDAVEGAGQPEGDGEAEDGAAAGSEELAGSGG